MQLLVKFPLIYSAVQNQIMIWGKGLFLFKICILLTVNIINQTCKLVSSKLSGNLLPGLQLLGLSLLIDNCTDISLRTVFKVRLIPSDWCWFFLTKLTELPQLLFPLVITTFFYVISFASIISCSYVSSFYRITCLLAFV